MNEPDPLNRPLPYFYLPTPLPEWIHTVVNVMLITVGAMAAFFTLIFIIAVFRDER